LTNNIVCGGNRGTVQLMPMSTAGAARAAARDQLVDAILEAGGDLAALAARSLASVDVTVAQHRVLAELAHRGPCRLAELAAALEVDRSTASRIADRLARKRLVNRRRLTADRRGVRVSLTQLGRVLVEEVDARRRLEVSGMVERMGEADAARALAALRLLSDAAGDHERRGLPAGPDPAW
jgi:DNA-binding MarR family transcriptional regulator